MGLLKESTTLSWKETQEATQEVKRRGVEHFIEVYKKEKVASKPFGFLWGEEIEQNLVWRIDGNWALLVGSDIVIQESKEPPGLLNIEYARYMVETTPKAPYEPRFAAFGRVEKNMEERRVAINRTLKHLFGESASMLYLPCFPLLGTPFAFGMGGMSPEKRAAQWTSVFEATAETGSPKEFPEEKKEPLHADTCINRVRTPSFKITRSRHFPDFGITSHRRFYNFTYNIRERKGRPLNLEIPPARIEKNGAGDADAGTTPPVVIDSMGQGMGCCCLQITMQSESLAEARFLYDTIGAVCPLLLFLTMATSVVGGTLVESSTRWDIVSASVDCRKPSETEIKKSRYSSIDLYVSELSDTLYGIYNDINPPLDPSSLSLLQTSGVDRALANHIASLYIRDPILCYSDSSPRDDFENIQSSNWRSMRLKPPKLDGPKPGAWLVEIRPMEIQPTSFENTAYSVFVVLFSRMAVSLNATFYLPISKVDANFRAATLPQSSPGSIAEWMAMEETQEFWYRENIFSNGEPVIKRGTIKEIFLGTGDKYCGILGAIDQYLQEYNEEDQKKVAAYMQFIRDRVSGKKTSVATYIRKYVSKHPEYKGDSVVPLSISNDLVSDMLGITNSNSSEYLNK